MNPQTADDFINEATYSLDDQEYQRAAAEALVAIALLLSQTVLHDDEQLPAGPIDYERHHRVDRC